MSEARSGSTERVGVIGLGIIGSVWAQHYQAAGLLEGTWNRSAKPQAPRPAASPAALARAATVLHIVVADPPAVDGVLGALEAELGPRHLVMQSTTIDPHCASRFAERV